MESRLRRRGGRGNSGYIMNSAGLSLRYSASSAQIFDVKEGLRLGVKVADGAKLKPIQG